MSTSQGEKRRDSALSALDALIEALNTAGDTCGIPTAQVAFSSASILLTIIRDTMTSDFNYPQFAWNCANVCRLFYQKLKGRRSDELSQSVFKAIEDLTATLAQIRWEVIKQGKLAPSSRINRFKSNKDRIIAWKKDFARVLEVINAELPTDTHTVVADIYQNVLTGEEGTSDQSHLTQDSIPRGTPPPLLQRVCFGRDELIEEIVQLAENFKPMALIGPAGIGKTTIALTVLHHHRIKDRFGENGRFIRCDQFPASRAHFLAQLSEAIGAEAETSEDLTPLRPFLSSNQIIIILDNAESVLDPHGTDAREIYALVDELCQFKTLCVLITSRITAVPRYCERLEIPTLSMESARDIFYHIYGDDRRSDITDDLLRRLYFHPLSITLLATTGAGPRYALNYSQLASLLNVHRTQALLTDYSESLIASIQPSLTSPTFHSLGPDARDLLEVVASVFPQGIDENSLDWLFPITSHRKNIDEFCGLSLLYRSNGFLTMLAPFRDYLSLKDPQSSPLFHATRDRYLTRFPVGVDADEITFSEARWILSEEENIEHLITTFTHPNQERGGIWDPCCYFYWRKPWQTIPRPKFRVLEEYHHPNPNHKQLEAVEEVKSRSISPSIEKGEEFLLCDIHWTLGKIHQFKGDKKKAIRHFETTLRIASPLKLHNELFWTHHYLADLFRDKAELDTANSHIERANSHAADYTLSHLPRTSPAQQPKEHHEVLSTLGVSIQDLDLAKDTCGILPVRVALGTAMAVLTTICYARFNNQNYVKLGLACANTCRVLYQTLKGGQLDELGPPALDAIRDLTTTLIEILRMNLWWVKRDASQKASYVGSRRSTVAAWGRELVRVLQVFDTELAISPYVVVVDVHQNGPAEQEDTSGQNRSAPVSTHPGELPPPAPSDCFGRGELIGKIIGFAEDLNPVALIGAGGIGKTSVALTFLHHNQIKNRFGENRRFIRCDQFPASPTHLLARISRAIGAGVENPKGLASLRPFLSDQEMVIILDNAESILDPKGTHAREIYSIVDELCQFKTIFLLITSHITTLPPRCRRLEIPTLSMEAACNIFYNIFSYRGRSTTINNLLERLDFHALSITLLASVASCNTWDHSRLAKEWGFRRAQVLQMDYNESLAATIELSIASPTFHELGLDARDLLGVVAFFPQGVNEKNLDWLFPTISDIKSIFDTFCALSLTYRSNGFVTMLTPIQEYLAPRDPRSSPLLCATRDIYFSRLSADVDPSKPGFKEAQWILSEDVNVEHLLHAFTDGGGAWDAYCDFMRHLYWHKPRETILKSKIEALPEDHCSKSKCLYELARFFGRIRNYPEQTRLLTHILELERRLGNDLQVVQALQHLSDVHRLRGLREAGIRQAEEALEILERISDTEGKPHCLNQLAWLLFEDKQLDPAEDAASHAIDLVSEKGQEFLACQLHRVLGKIRHSKGETTKAIHHFETALGIASPPNWHEELFWNHLSLAELFSYEEELDEANIHVKHARSHATDDTYRLGRAIDMQAHVWCLQCRLEDAKSEASRALEIYEGCGAVYDAEACRNLIRMVEEAIQSQFTGFRV